MRKRSVTLFMPASYRFWVMRRLSAGFRNGGAGDLDALLGCFETGVGAPDLETDGGIGTLLVEFGALHQVAGFDDAGFVRRSVEEIPADGDGGQPVGAAAIDKALAIGFECAAEADLRQHRAACAVGLGLRETGGEMGLTGFGAAGGRGALQGIQREFGQIERGERRCQGVRRVERQAERIVERGFRDIHIGCTVDALFRHGGKVNADRQDIDVGGHAGRADCFGARQVGLGGGNGLLRRLSGFPPRGPRRSRHAPPGR